MKLPRSLSTLLLALCLLAGQWLGAAHRIAHALPTEHGAGAAQHHTAHADAHAVAHADAHASAHGAIDAHHDHQAGDATCLLLDHALGQADAWLPQWQWPGAPAQAPQAAAARSRVAYNAPRWHPLARAPPTPGLTHTA